MATRASEFDRVVGVMVRLEQSSEYDFSTLVSHM